MEKAVITKDKLMAKTTGRWGDRCLFAPEFVSLGLGPWVRNTVSTGRTPHCGVRYTWKNQKMASQ